MPIRAALEWLIQNCPEYKEIQIDEDNLAQYPSDCGNIDFQTLDEEVEDGGKKKDKDCV